VAAARAFDEPSASIVDSLPRPLWWRTAARLVYPVLLAATWWVAVGIADVRPNGRPEVVRLEGVALILVGAATATLLRRRGRDAPGTAIGSALLLVVTTLAVLNPAHGVLPLFPFYDDTTWARAGWIWLTVAAVAAATLVLSCVEVSGGAARTASRAVARAAVRRPAARGSRAARTPAS
jgi:small-conductance mechanosensitive channel